ncbi:MAG: acyl-CoA thioesterase [Saprospiraceae bacterium]|nr:acyl-CoA thioesterase [Saprospiraceae bacterium]
MSNLSKQLQPFPVVTEIRVRWGEMDAYQHVNNVVYFRWAETARIDYLNMLSISLAEPNAQNEVLVIGQQECKYLLPVTYPDTIWVGTQIKEIKEDRLIMECQMYSEKNGRLAAISKHQIFILDKVSNQKLPIPNHWRKRIQEVQAMLLTS